VFLGILQIILEEVEELFLKLRSLVTTPFAEVVVVVVFVLLLFNLM
jgi:hypothetical protein